MAVPATTVEQLIGLNREIAALVRAGIPLDQGLQSAAALGDDVSRGLSQRIAQRLSSGANLSEALEAEQGEVPRAYRAIVAAGLRAGRLPEALEAVADLTESMQDVRRRWRLALVYPALVTGLALILLAFFVTYGVPRFVEMSETMRLPPSRILPVLEFLYRTLPIWAVGLPLLVLVAWVIGQVRSQSSRGASLDATRFIPGVGAIRLGLVRGWFCQLLASLVEHQVPLPEALELAGEAVDQDDLQASARETAESLRAGRSLAESIPSSTALSPMLRWMLTAGDAGNQLAPALRRAADFLLVQAHRRAEWFRVIAPVVTIVAVGGGVALLYGLAVFGPLVELLDRLTVEPFV